MYKVAGMGADLPLFLSSPYAPTPVNLLFQKKNSKDS